MVCNIPGLAIVAGYLGHSARLGCTKCLKPFQTTQFSEKPYFSGFNRDQWPKQDTPTHMRLANQYKILPNRLQQKALKLEHGLQYSELLQLLYFVITCFFVVGPMHNLFQGSACHFMDLILEKGLLARNALAVVKQKLLRLNQQPPFDVGRLPLKVASKLADSKETNGKIGLSGIASFTQI